MRLTQTPAIIGEDCLRFKHQEGPCVIEWRDYGNRLHLLFIKTERGYRKQGRARELLRALCGDADRRALAVTLAVMPCDSYAMDYHQLISWYRSFGFAELDDSGSMRREPKRPPVAPELVWQPVTSHDWMT